MSRPSAGGHPAEELPSRPIASTPSIIADTAGSVVLVGSDEMMDVFFGRGGNDRLSGADNDDDLLGTLYGGGGADHLDGGEDNDHLYARMRQMGCAVALEMITSMRERAMGILKAAWEPTPWSEAPALMRSSLIGKVVTTAPSILRQAQACLINSR